MPFLIKLISCQSKLEKINLNINRTWPTRAKCHGLGWIACTHPRYEWCEGHSHDVTRTLPATCQSRAQEEEEDPFQILVCLTRLTPSLDMPATASKIAQDGAYDHPSSFLFLFYSSLGCLQFGDMIAWESFMPLGLLCVFWGCLDDCCVVSWKNSQCLVGIGNMFRSVPPCCELVANCSM